MLDESKSREELLDELRNFRKKNEYYENVESIYKLIYENSLDAIIITQPDGRIFSANPAACKMFGRTEAEICTIGRSGLLDESDSTIKELIAKRDEEGYLFTELDYFRSDGSICNAEISSKIFETKSGEKRTCTILRDISYRKVMEKQQNFHYGILSNINDAVIAVDENMRIIYWNNAAESIYGWSAQEASGKVIQDLLSAVFVNISEEEVLKILYTEGKWSGEIIQKNKKGDELYILVTTTFTFDESGKMVGAVTINHDITQMKNLLHIIKSNEIKYRSIFELAPVGISLLDESKKIVEMNSALQKITQLSYEDILNQKYSERKYIKYGGSEYTENDFASTRALQENAPVYNVEVGIKTEKDKIIWTNVSAAPVYLPDKYIIVITQDITEKINMIDTLRIAENHFKLAQSLAKMGSWIWDIKGGSIQWSDDLFLIFGVDKNVFEATIENIGKLVHPEDLDIFYTGMSKILVPAQHGEFEFRIIRPDGIIGYLFQAYEVYFDKSGQPLKAYGIIQDITNRKIAEDNLRALSKSLHNAKEEEKINLSRELHDNVGQSLTSIKIDLALMQKQFSKLLDNDGKKNFLDKTSSLIEQTDSLIQSIRQISTELRPNILDTLGLIAALEWQLEEMGKRTKIRFSFSSTVETIELTSLNATAVYRIFQEALTNIIRHSNATTVDCNIWENNGTYNFSIKDDGVGISQIKMNTSTSIGLISMKERAQLMDGKLLIKSSKADGTEILLTIPRYNNDSSNDCR